MQSESTYRRRMDGEASTGEELYDFVVIGAGPGGLTAVGTLIDNGIDRIAWIDPSFSSGRMGEKYTEVPSNTKVQLFLDYVRSSPTFSRLVKQLETPNAYCTLESMDLNQGTLLKYAVDLFNMLTRELISCHSDKLKIFKGLAQTINLVDKNKWIINLNLADSKEIRSLRAKKIVLATGSKPRLADDPTLLQIDLETALAPSKLQSMLKDIDHQNQKVGVVGSSHSAILVLKNLIEYSAKLQIVHLYRSELKFAENKNGWILYDNTGLKGDAADWARNDYPKLNERIMKIKLSSDNAREQQQQLSTAARQHLKDCSRVIYAIGYQPYKSLKVFVDGTEVENYENNFDHLTGDFHGLSFLFGCGIAFPQRAVDRAGNVELSVGVFKFMKFLKLVVPQWVQA